MKIPDLTLYTMIQLVFGAAMGIAGFALVFGVLSINQLPIPVLIAVCMLCIAALFLRDAMIQMLSAMSTNVEEDEQEEQTTMRALPEH
jgi:protein-S-isoprenylcysteine O-methyltransferase Ste14